MSFTWRVLFDGLCGFVPNTAGDRMTVLLPNLRIPTTSRRGTKLLPHAPVIQFRLEDLELDDATPAFEVLSGFGGPDVGLLFLDGCDVSFEVRDLDRKSL